jgi:hypothetical protein
MDVARVQHQPIEELLPEGRRFSFGQGAEVPSAAINSLPRPAPNPPLPTMRRWGPRVGSGLRQAPVQHVNFCSRVCTLVAEVVLFPFRCLAVLFAWVMSPLARLALKASLYRDLALQDGCITRYICAPLFRAILNLWSCCRGGGNFGAIEPARLEKADHFICQFADYQQLQTPDGRTIRFALYRPEKFAQWIEERGGVRYGDWICPRRESDWEKLQELREFKWFKEEDRAFRIPPPTHDLAQKCVLRVQGFGRTIPMDKAFIGAHLAMGISYAVFDWRERDLTSTGFFHDAETAYQALRKEGFAPNHIIPMGSCRSTFIIGKLKEDHHKEGMPAVLVQPPPSLEAAIRSQNCIASYLGMSVISDVETQAHDYDTLARLRRLEQSDRARLCLIFSENDTTLPPNTERDFQDAATHAGHLDLIVQKTEEGSDSHLQEPLRNTEVFERYTQFLLSV